MKRFIISLVLIFLLALGIGLFARHLWFSADHIDLVPQIVYNDESPLAKTLNPQICTFSDPYVPATTVEQGKTEHILDCPPNRAFYGTEDPGRGLRDGPGRYVSLRATCCPLPADDILTDDHIYGIESNCPENFVATGGSEHNCGSHCGMRCTRINLEKYRLGPKRKSFYWRVEWDVPSAGRGLTRQIRFRHIPVAIRKALAETDDLSWTREEDNCIGIPFGSLLVEKNDSHCSGFFFRQLLFRETGEPVRMFPDCVNIKNGQCIKADQK